jgi:hypothetical protein
MSHAGCREHLAVREYQNFTVLVDVLLVDAAPVDVLLLDAEPVDVEPVDVEPVDVVPVGVVPLELVGAATTSIVTVPVIGGLVLLSVMVNVSVPTTVPTATWKVATPSVIVIVAGTVTVTPVEQVTATATVPL